MSWTKNITIWCDECEEFVETGERTVGRARPMAENLGWDCSTDEDLCPNCAADTGGEQ